MVLFSMLTLTLFVLACGGSDDNGDDSPTAAAGSQQGNSPTATPRQSSNSDVTADTAVITVGTKKYEFSMDDILGIDRCITSFGVVAGAGEASDGSDVDLQFSVPPNGYENKRGFEDFEAPNLQVDDEVNGQEWVAGGDFTYLADPPETSESRVDSYVSEDGLVTGTATFIDLDAYNSFTFGGQTTRPVPVSGTFEIHCGA